MNFRELIEKSEQDCFEYDGDYIIISDTKVQVVNVRNGQVKSTYFKHKINKRYKRNEIIFLG
jgi:hypothetical protein